MTAVGAGWARRNTTLLIEAVLMAGVVYSAVWALNFLFVVGRLPQPYFRGPSDTIMDWINVAWYANNPGAYYQYQAVYPPLAFDFLQALSIHSCYRFDAGFARDCDWMARVGLLGTWVAASIVTFLVYRKHARRTALIRATAMTFGLPMLYALERGNLVIVTYVFFVLGHGRLLKSAVMRWISVALSINFKPYLVLAAIPYLLKRRWRWVEGAAITTVIVYLISFAMKGVGTPQEILANTLDFTDQKLSNIFDWAYYATTYQLIIEILKSDFPVMFYLGSTPIEVMETLFPAMIHLGQAGVVLAFLGSLWRPGATPNYRLVALAVAVASTTTNVGGYSQIFLLFLVFLEPWRGPLRIAALLLSYGLCVSYDISIITVAHQMELSWLTGRLVGIDLSLQAGELIRPGIILLIEYALTVAALVDIWRARDRVPAVRRLPEGAPPSGTMAFA